MQLELGVAALVLLAALMHAGWNTLVKTGSDPLLTMVLVFGSSSLIALCAIPFVTPPLYGSWGFICLSMLLHTGYKVILLRAYRVGDLSQVYPLARGTAPLLIAVLSSLLAGEVLGAGQAAGVGVICLGVISLTFGGGLPRRKDLPALGFALGTGMFIASYTTVDGLGVRAAGSAAGYIAWLLFLVEMPFNLGALLMRRGKVLAYLNSQWKQGLAGGAMTLLAYGLVVWALSRGAMAPVAALRETGVIFAALIGALVLGEPFGKGRVLAAVIIAGGIALLGISSMGARI
ncbi:MAG: EamA family transporter [SAR324 cluster bacterium]|nr:EamA family transporter [SAR324 cluster bacterium]MCZ6628528.1 EamA family transporter [SAR324 cluster bacterium]